MAGLGMILGGALSGFGAGLAKQGEMDWTDRREMALEALRSQREQANLKAQADEQRTTQVEAAKLDDWKDARKTERDTKSTISINKVQSDLIEGREARLKRIEAEIRRTDAATADALSRAARSGEVSDTFQDAQGNYFALMKDGTTKPLGVRGALKTQGGGALERYGYGSDTGSTPPANRPPLSSFGG